MSMKDFCRINWGWISAIVGIMATLVGVGMTYRGLTAQIAELQVSVQRQDGRLNSHEERLLKVEKSLLNLDRIEVNIVQIREKSAAIDTRIANLEKLITLSSQVDLDSKRIDRIESTLAAFMAESAKDRSSLNAKLDGIQSTLTDLIRMHMQNK